MSNTDPNVFRLENVRLSYPQLWTAKAMMEGQDPRFSASFIFDNTNPAHIAILDRIEAQASRAALDYWKKAVRLSGSLVRDGNEKSDTDGYGEGTSFLTAGRKTRPVVVDLDPSIPITEQDGKLNAGDYVNATIRLWVQDSHGQKRVNAELRAVQFLRKGVAFGTAAVNAEDEFEKIDSEHGGSQTTNAPTRSTRSGAKPAGGAGFF